MTITPDQMVRDLAAHQLGLVTRAQCLERGLSARQYRARIRTGQLVEVHAGVVRLPGANPTLEQRALAGSLACAPDAYASHTTAGALWGAIEDVGTLHITVPTARRPRVEGVRVHRSELLRPHERTALRLVPVTTPALTLVNLAGMCDDLELARAVDNMFRLGVLTPERLLAYLTDLSVARFPRVAVVRDIAADRAELGVSESDMETLAIELIRLVSLPLPLRQYRIPLGSTHMRIDLAYPDRKFGVELDGRESRRGYDPFRLDRERQNELEDLGWRFRRFTWEHLAYRPGYFVGTVAHSLGLLPARWPGRPHRWARAAGRPARA